MMTAHTMHSARGKTWRHGVFDGPSGRAEREGDVVPPEPPSPKARHQGGQRVWAFLCPNPTCDTELVVFPEYAGSTVQCPACGFTFLAPRVVPLQIASEGEEGDGPRPPRPFAPGAMMARRGPPASPRPPRSAPRPPALPVPAAPPAPPPAPPQRGPSTQAASDAAAAAREAQAKPKVDTAEVAAQIAQDTADGTRALEALARSVGDGDRPAGTATPPAPATGPHASGPATPSPAASEALRALAQAAGTPGAAAKRKRPARGKKGGSLSSQMASAAFEGDRRRARRVHTAGDPSAAKQTAARTGRETASAASPLPLSEGERNTARRQRTDLVVTWVVAAVVSAGLTLTAYVTGVPDIGLGSLLFLGLAGARTWWVTRTPGGTPRP